MMKSLFDYTEIKNMKLKNRFIRSALSEMVADKKGHMTNELYHIYKELAQGGVGTIITGYAYITEDEQPSPNMMGIYEDSFINEYKELTDMVHENNTNIIMQIVYGGSQTELSPPSTNILGPSAVENEVTKVTPREMTKEDILYIIKKFGDAAERVKKAGFDGVEIHGAHGYLLSQFMCPHYNKRSDEYGGTIDNRARIVYEVYSEVRKRVGDDYPVWIKINSEDFMKDGLTSEESIHVSKRLADLGIDAIEVSGGSESSKSTFENNQVPSRIKIAGFRERESYHKKYAEKLAKEIEIPVILVGGNRQYDVMDELLNNSDIEYFALARPLTAEPSLINQWYDSKEKKKPKCVSCNKCLDIEGKRCIFNIRR